MQRFAGFSKNAFKFLGDLAKHNEKKWFDAHRDRYEDELLEPSKVFVDTMGGHLRSIAPNIIAEPRVNGSIRRINRDVRFSKDKRPYKDHWDFHFPDGDTKTCSTSSYMLRLTGSRVYVVAGSHEFSKPALKKFRDAIEDGGGVELDKIVKKLRKSGYEIGRVGYKQTPRGYSADNPHAEYLLFSGLYAAHSGPVPKEAHTSKFAGWCMGHYKKLRPLHEWITSNLA